MPGYGIKPVDEGELLPWSFVSERMAAAHNYWVASTRPDGRPHAAPVWGLWHADVFYFSSGAESARARNLAANPRAVVHLESGDEAVILEGQIGFEDDDALLSELNARYEQKYGVGLVGAGLVYRLELERALAWREADFPAVPRAGCLKSWTDCRLPCHSERGPQARRGIPTVFRPAFVAQGIRRIGIPPRRLRRLVRNDNQAPRAFDSGEGSAFSTELCSRVIND